MYEDKASIKLVR